MSARIDLRAFRSFGLPSSIEVGGETVGDCLEALTKQLPQMQKMLFNKEGKLNGYVEILVNGTSVYPQDLMYQVKDGDVITALAVLGGG